MEPLSQCLRLALHTEQSTVRSWLRAEEKPLVLLLLFSFNSFFDRSAWTHRAATAKLRPTVSRRERRVVAEETSLNFFIILAWSGPTCRWSASGLPRLNLRRQEKQYLRCVAVLNSPSSVRPCQWRAGGGGRGSDSHIFYCVFTNHFDWFSEVVLNDWILVTFDLLTPGPPPPLNSVSCTLI